MKPRSKRNSLKNDRSAFDLSTSQIIGSTKETTFSKRRIGVLHCSHGNGTSIIRATLRDHNTFLFHLIFRCKPQWGPEQPFTVRL